MKLYCYRNSYPDSYKLVNLFMSYKLHDIKTNNESINDGLYKIAKKEDNELEVVIIKELYRSTGLVSITKINVKLIRSFDYAINKLYRLEIRGLNTYKNSNQEMEYGHSWWNIEAIGKIDEFCSMFKIDKYLNVKTDKYDVPEIIYFDKYMLPIEEISKVFWE